MSDPTPLDALFLAFQQAVAERYFIDREIGRGGMGVVYLAREVQLDRMVAIKLLRPALAARAEWRARFVGEARLAARLSHPNIVPLHAVDESGDFVYFVMALVDGVTLAERVRTRGPVSASAGARLLREVAFALEYAHGQGVVHRDVKPDNILLDRATGRALVADFGIAAVAGGDAARGAAGTPAFMSPEQLLGEPTDARSDLYSFGVTAYYALSGRLPFDGATMADATIRAHDAAPAPLTSLGLAIPRRLAQLVDRCLANDPNARPASAQVVAEELGVALEQRRDVPAVLRGFVKRTGRTSNGQAVITLAAIGLLGMPVSYYFGPGAAFSVVIGGALASQVAFLASGARGLLELGFTQADLRPAFAALLDASREERSVADSSYRRLERLSRAVGRMAGTALAFAALPAAYAWLTGQGRDTVMLVWPVLAIAAWIGVAGFGASVVLRRLRDDIDTRFWASLWNGRIGTAVFALARRFRRGAPVVSAVTHRATELSLGMAAEQLYESLPRASRRLLRNLPALLRRLQGDAQALRARFDALNDALMADGRRQTTDGRRQQESGYAAASDARESRDASDFSDARDAVRAERDVVQGRLRDAVGALETIRLNLLRLHAGQATVESLTTQIGVASALSDDVRRLIAAHADVAAALELPRVVTPTPV